MTLAAPRHSATSADAAALREIEQRVLWRATAVVDHADRVRPDPSGLGLDVDSLVGAALDLVD
jgi:pyruvate dehydrogenase E1 component